MLCVLLPAAPAAAHNSLGGSDPADGARIDKAPAQIRLSFLSRLDPKKTVITVKGPDGIPAAGGAPRFDGSKVTVPFAPGPAGRYTVTYQVPSGDGHPVKGDIEFTLTTSAEPAEPPAASAEPTSTPSAAAATSPAGTPTSPAAAVPLDRAGSDDGPARWPWIVAPVLVLAALVGGVLVLRARRRTG